jgi:pimeloyl-ACP methyl ester carboxylesterase
MVPRFAATGDEWSRRPAGCMTTQWVVLMVADRVPPHRQRSAGAAVARRVGRQQGLAAPTGHAFAAEFTDIAWDAPGCGDSDDLPSPDYGLDDLIDTLAGFIRALRLGRPHVIGLSLGSVLAIALYARYPTSVRSLVLASAYAGWAGSLPPAEVQRRFRLTLQDLNRPADEVALEFVATLLPGDAPQWQVDEQIEMITQARPATTRAMLTHVAPVDLRPALSRIKVPTLLLYGDADVRATTPVAAALHAQIPGSLLVQLPGIGHCGHVQAPEQWNRAVLDFLHAQP